MGEYAIDVWYGSRQSFGRLGNPQRWANVLGTVSRADELLSLAASVNGGAERPLKVGPDGYRLRGEGDFNVDVALEELTSGENRVALRSSWRGGRSADCDVVIDYTAGQTWPLPYKIDWSRAGAVSDCVQIVDGRWKLTAGGIRPVHPAYDRLVAVGDMEWTDYRLTVPATIHGFCRPERIIGGFGLLFRWTGHRKDEHQPYREWRPNGAIGWYRAHWEDSPVTYRSLNISDAVVKDVAITATGPCELKSDKRYVFEMSVRSRRGATGLYRYRVWAEAREDELLCDLEAEAREGEAPRGSALLIALRADVTIGNLSAEPL